jgi:hypothetical protein
MMQPRSGARYRTIAVAWLALGTLLLAGCGDDMLLHTGTRADLERSLERITARLSESDAKEFDAALRDIVVLRMGARAAPELAQLRAELDAYPEPAPASSPRDHARAMAREIEADWENRRVEALRENAAALLDRRSVEEIRTMAQKERERVAERSRSGLSALLDDARARLREVETRLQRLRPDRLDDAAVLAGIVVSTPTLMSRPGVVEDDLILTFTLRNASEMRPGRIHFLVTVTRGGIARMERRAVVAYDIPGGLQTNATQRHVVKVTRLVREAMGEGARLSEISVVLAPVRLEDARSRRVGLDAVEELEFERLALLRDLVARIEAHAVQVASAG